MNGEDDHIHLHEGEKQDLVLHATLCYERYGNITRQLKRIADIGVRIQWAVVALVALALIEEGPDFLKILRIFGVTQ